MPEPSIAQKNFLAKRSRHRRIVMFLRFALILLFLFLWEAAADLNWIDAFIFSSPSRVARHSVI